MKNRIFHFFIILSLFSCRNYNSENYINAENEAIKEIIPQITDFKRMSKMNTKDIGSLKLYLISTLDIQISEIYEPKEEYTISVDGVDLSESKILENKTQNLKEIESARNEKELFADLINGIIRERKLEYKFEYPNLKIELISKNADINNDNLTENEFGYLSISRIIFNRNFDKGYLSYTFSCGSACAWQDNVEITKINGKWKVTESFSGWII
jgi:hypothetical protein